MNRKTIIALLIIFAVFFTASYALKSFKDSSITPEVQNINSTSIRPQKTYDKKVVISKHEINVVVANTANELARGLSVKESLNDDEGMLFDFPEKDHTRIFWMKGMTFPIDIIWINDNKIIGIEKEVQPEPGVDINELERYFSPEPVDLVLEIRAGLSDEKEFEVGDEVVISDL